MFVISGSVHLSLACLLRNIPEVCDAALLDCRFGGCAVLFGPPAVQTLILSPMHYTSI